MAAPDAKLMPQNGFHGLVGLAVVKRLSGIVEPEMAEHSGHGVFAALSTAARLDSDVAT